MLPGNAKVKTALVIFVVPFIVNVSYNMQIHLVKGQCELQHVGLLGKGSV